MNVEERMNIYRELVVDLACAIYNEEDWDKQRIISALRLGDPSFDYETRGIPPDELTREAVIMAMDNMFRQAGL